MLVSIFEVNLSQYFPACMHFLVLKKVTMSIVKDSAGDLLFFLLLGRTFGMYFTFTTIIARKLQVNLLIF